WGKDQYGNPLPYLDGIRVSFIKDKKSSLLKFRKNELDMMYRIPLEMTNEVITENDELKGKYKQYDLQVMPSLTIQYYGFQHKSDLFANKHLRKAFNYAIDRTEIVDYTLKGTAVPAHNGVVPPALENYDSKAINGYKYNAAKAREHMKQAGYPNGEGFPEITLQINSGGGRNEQVAEAIQKMLQENLNISMNIKKLSFAQHLENLESGKARFWRAGWIADYPDPENFLNLFYGPHVPDDLNTRSYINSVRYQSAEFDSVFQKALKTVDKQQRNLLYLQADQIVMDDAAIMPIYYDKDYRLLQPDVRNFPQNPMEYRNFRDVYFVPDSDQKSM
ncbi:MAG: ABC transporter substrate-binding protein, partial [Bacteroidetes bacterium SW_11_45_7]